MDPIVEEFTIILKYQVSVNTDTGEMTTKCISRKIDKSNFEVTETKKRTTKRDENPIPTLTLEDSKYCLNQAAVDLMNIEPGCRLDIKYEKQGKAIIPVIGTDESFGTHQGNRLSKSLTVICKGSKNQELAKYGTEFTIVSHESKDSIFILKSAKEEDVIEDMIEDTVDELAELQDILDNEDVTEIDSSIFKL